MKRLLKLIILTGIGLSTHVALATGNDFKGKTNCTILKNDKLVKTAPCSYTGTDFGSFRYTGLSYNFNVKDFGKISTQAGVSAKTDDEGNMLQDPDPDKGILYNPLELLLNGKPATIFSRSKTFKVISAKAYEKMSKKEKEQTLNCMQQKASELEICVPAKDAYLGY